MPIITGTTHSPSKGSSSDSDSDVKLDSGSDTENNLKTPLLGGSEGSGYGVILGGMGKSVKPKTTSALPDNDITKDIDAAFSKLTSDKKKAKFLIGAPVILQEVLPGSRQAQIINGVVAKINANPSPALTDAIKQQHAAAFDKVLTPLAPANTVTSATTPTQFNSVIPRATFS